MPISKERVIAMACALYEKGDLTLQELESIIKEFEGPSIEDEDK